MSLGPATYKDPSGIDKLVGILSGGLEYCGHDGGSSYYTSVYKYLKWICDNVDEKDNLAGVCAGGSGCF